jgi:hypothetical protein
VAPNPFRSATEIALVLPRDGVVDLTVFDLSGRRVSWIVDHRPLASGEHHRAWNGRRDGGAVASAGVYLVRVDTPAGLAVRTLGEAPVSGPGVKGDAAPTRAPPTADARSFP